MAKFNRTPPEPVTLRPGESRVVKAMLENDFMYGRPAGKDMDWLKHLPVGTYRVAIDRKLGEFVDWRRVGEPAETAPAERRWPHPFWTGAITTKPVELEITAEGGPPTE